MPASTARSATLTRLLRWLGARTMAETRRLMKSSTMEAWPVKSVSIWGADQSISTPASFAAASAPARTVCQNTWTWPLGTTAIVGRAGPALRLQQTSSRAGGEEGSGVERRLVFIGSP